MLQVGGDTSAMDLHEAGSPLSFLTGGGRRLLPLPGINPLLWAMAAGVAVVAEDGDALHGVVEDGHGGFIVPRGDLNAVTDRLIHLHDDRSLAARVGGAARERVHTAFHVSTYCARLRQIYERMVAGRPIEVETEAGEAIERYDPAAMEWTTA